MYGDEEISEVAPMVYLRVLSTNAITHTQGRDQKRAHSRRVTKSDGDILLSPGDVLGLGQAVSVIFCVNATVAPAESVHDVVEPAVVQHLSPRYEIQNRILGTGAFAWVAVVVERDTGRQLACKILKPQSWRTHRSTRTLQEAHRVAKNANKVAREYTVLKDLSHPNIISLEKVFCTPENVYLVQELVTGGDLFGYLERRSPLAESEAVLIIFQLLKAIEYLHDHQVVHRDIKPENVLMTAGSAGTRVILTDFGQSRLLEAMTDTSQGKSTMRMQSVVGTPAFLAPEVVQTIKSKPHSRVGYSKAVDIWCLGCVTACVLPIRSLVSEEQIRQNSDDFRKQHEQKLATLDEGQPHRAITHSAKSFVRNCLAFDETERIDCKQALKHRWFTNKNYATELHAAYDRAIADWKPVSIKGVLVEYVGDPGIGKSASMRPESAYSTPSSATSPVCLPARPDSQTRNSSVHHRPNAGSPEIDRVVHFESINSVALYAEGDLHAKLVDSLDESEPLLDYNIKSCGLSQQCSTARQVRSGHEKGRLASEKQGHSNTTHEDILPVEPDLSVADIESLKRKLPQAIKESAAVFGREIDMKRGRLMQQMHTDV